MKLRCACGRDVDVPEGEAGASVLCPDCGQPLGARPHRSSPVPPPPPDAPQKPRPSPILILGAVVVVLLLMILACAGLFAAVFLPALNDARAQSDRVVCGNNLRLIGTSLFMYAGENKGDFPPLPAQPGRLMFESEAVFPEYLENPSVFLCPSLETPPPSIPTQAIDDGSYLYLSHVILDNDEGAAFARVCRERRMQGLPMSGDIPVPPDQGSAGTDRLLQLRAGVERLLASDPLDREEADALMAAIPVLIEWPLHHDTPGGNVLYLDGHVDFVPYPGPFPMTEPFIAVLRQLNGQQ